MKKDILKEAEEDKDEDKVTPEDEETPDVDADAEETAAEEDPEETEEEPDEMEDEPDEEGDVLDDSDLNSEDVEDEGDGNGWSEFDDYKIGDDVYDLTGVKDASTVAKVFKLMKDEDQVSVKKEGDMVSISDKEEGTEYVIELNTENEEDNEELNDFPMTEEKIDLGYTTTYQKDPMPGLKMDGEDDWGSKGAPKGNKRPWVGKGDMDPFKEQPKEKVFEIVLNDDKIDEEYGAGGNVQNRSTTMSGAHRGQKYRNARGPKTTGTVESPINDSRIEESVNRKLNSVMKENKELKSLLNKVKSSLMEAVQINVNLGQMVKLMTENTTSKAEKEEIIKKFSDAKTPQESKALYESFSSTLKKSQSNNIIKEDASIANGSAINETKVYENEGANEVLSFMDRLAKC